MKPTLRKGFSDNLSLKIKESINKIIQDKDIIQFPYRTCLNCDNFLEKSELCKLVYQRPPARVIAFGCDKHDDTEQIPF